MVEICCCVQINTPVNQHILTDSTISAISDPLRKNTWDSNKHFCNWDCNNYWHSCRTFQDTQSALQWKLSLCYHTETPIIASLWSLPNKANMKENGLKTPLLSYAIILLHSSSLDHFINVDLKMWMGTSLGFHNTCDNAKLNPMPIVEFSISLTVKNWAMALIKQFNFISIPSYLRFLQCHKMTTKFLTKKYFHSSHYKPTTRLNMKRRKYTFWTKSSLSFLWRFCSSHKLTA